ncbi:endonuclease/exonuclease/phosphatase family protein [Microbacterium sp. NPDC055903]
MTRRPISPARRRAARVLVALSILGALVIALGWVPGPLGTAISVVLPLLAVIVLLLALVTALVLPRATIATLLAVVLALVAMAPALPGFAGPAGAEALTIVSQNVRAQSGGGAASADELRGDDPDVITLTELDAASRDAAGQALAEAYPHSYAVGTVGVWSRYPLSSGEPLGLGLGWNRALRVTVQAPGGDVRLYLVHAASVRPGAQSARDGMLGELARVVAADAAPLIIALGDFNSATTDPALRALGAQLDLVRPTDGSLGFSWPAALPLVKIDHVFQRGFAVTSATTQRAGASDHLATVTVLSPR